MLEVILDTNFFLLPYSNGIDIIGEIKGLLSDNSTFIVSTQIIKELNNLNNPGVSLGLQVLNKLIDSGEIKVIESNVFVDDWIVKYVTPKTNVIVCTNDSNLRKRIKPKGGRIISLRTNRRLDFV